MTCVRCEIIRAKAWAIVLFNVGLSLPEICDLLNEKYSGTFAATATGLIVRYAAPDVEDYAVIFRT